MISPTKLTDELAVISQIDPRAASAITLSGDVFDMSKWEKALAILQVGTILSGTVDLKFQCAASATASYADFSPAKAITQFTAADDNKQALLNLKGSELPDGKRWVKPVVTVAAVGSAGNYVSLTVLGGVGRHLPAADNDVASVDEIV